MVPRLTHALVLSVLAAARLRRMMKQTSSVTGVDKPMRMCGHFFILTP